jgi:hypothetical protein
LEPGLADKVRLLARRRRRRRRVAAGSVLTVAVAVSALSAFRQAHDGPGNQEVVQTVPLAPPAPVQVVTAAELQRAKADAEAQLAATRTLLAVERRRRGLDRLNRALAATGPEARAPAPPFRAQAALMLVGHAERLNTRANQPAEALAAYRRTVELFPDTPSAAVARQRIQELESQTIQEIPS